MRVRLLALVTTIGVAFGGLTMVAAAPAGAIQSRCDQPNALPMRPGQSISYVREVYQSLFGRPADAPGAFYWASRIEDGMPRIGFTCFFTHHPEFLQDWVTVSYESYLGRGPDGPGLAYFVGELQAGRMDSQIVDIGILGSEEYFRLAGGTNDGFLRAIYQDVLGRAPDPGGLAYWTGRLDQGTPRWVVGQLVMYSRENGVNWVTHFLNEHLDGVPTAQEIEYWLGMHTANGFDLIVTLAEILASATGVDGADGGLGSGSTGSMPPI